jgi:alkanesulfonate monooxygenase SsuD/methylene tetrahydromethanopterin reductase-like flavin-dependent oxidoreductase (luciferase family)
MKLGTFLFTQYADPAKDEQGIAETLAEAKLAEELGYDAVWLAEHHFDGTCIYVDPVAFSAALSQATSRVKIGFAVIQASLHHPLRLAEQLALVDHLSRGRLIVGLGRGSMFNNYEYAAYEIDPQSSRERFVEIEDILLKCWAGGHVAHNGKFWNFDIPNLRPRPFTRPHPPIVHALVSEASTLALAKSGGPFLMAGPAEAIVKRCELYRRAMREAGHDEAAIARAFAESWAWQHVVVADSDERAVEIGLPAFEGMMGYRATLEANPVFGEIAKRVGPRQLPRSLVAGAPATVAEQLAPLRDAGIGGLILRFRIGEIAHQHAVASQRLFMDKVAPMFGKARVEAAQ